MTVLVTVGNSLRPTIHFGFNSFSREAIANLKLAFNFIRLQNTPV